MTPVVTCKLVPLSFAVGVEFPCGNCGRATTIRLDDVAGPFTCRQCSTRLTVPAVACFYRASCDGTYATCGGVVRKLSPQELALEEARAWEGQQGGDGGPTDDSLEGNRDVRGSIVSYACASCHERWTARQGTSLHFSWSGPSTCPRTVCRRCRRVPTTDELRAAR